jgi:hypothetical protein
MVHEINHGAEVLYGYGTKVESLREDTTKSSIGILILSTFPWVVCVSKEDRDSGISFDHIPECKLTSTVIGDGSREWVFGEYPMDTVCSTIWHEISTQIETRLLNVGEHTFATASLHRVAFP